MRPITVFALILSLAASPVFAGMILVQDPNDDFTCELRGASMVATTPESYVIFPQEDECVEAGAESRDLLQDDGASAVEIASLLRAASE